MPKKYYSVTLGESSLIDRLKGRFWLRLSLASTQKNGYQFHDIALRGGDIIQIDTSKHPAIMHISPPKTNRQTKGNKLPYINREYIDGEVNGHNRCLSEVREALGLKNE